MVGAGSRDDAYAMATCELGEPLKVRQDLSRTVHVERSGRLEKVALGVDVDEHKGAFEHVFAYPLGR